jgi:uncharacterized membrane protein YeaQ/YmgE (transglycosylase-associated protein family)
MRVIGWIIFGLVVGIVAKFLMPGRDPGGFIITILLGIAGALLGGFLGGAAGFTGRAIRLASSWPSSDRSRCSYCIEWSPADRAGFNMTARSTFTR